MKKIIFILAGLFMCFNIMAQNTKKILVLTEGTYNVMEPATAQGRQLTNLLGHFNCTVTHKSAEQYIESEIKNYDVAFYIGLNAGYKVSKQLLTDISSLNKKTIWINEGIISFSQHADFINKYGFSVVGEYKNLALNMVKCNNKKFTKRYPQTQNIQINNKQQVNIIATAYVSKSQKEVPYIVESQNLTYVADVPFLGANETDRYLLFCDLLHDFIGEQHPERHQAILRIEDITPLDDPNNIRDVADILSAKGIPFLIGVVPFYVNPTDDRRVSLSERPELVDALKYAIANGATLVMHGVTHQYRGITADDFEFWDGAAREPIADENEGDISNKIELGINEFMKNGLSPMLWETPHYGASMLTYQTVAKYFSSAIEQRLVNENFDYGQYFPYIINKDIYGQVIYPENQGYIPLHANLDTSRKYVTRIIENCRTMLNVRDGIASCFFHAFLNHKLLTQLVNGVSNLGYTFIDLRQQHHWVKTSHQAILCGSQKFKIKLDNSFLHEIYFNDKGEIIKKSTSENRVKGKIEKQVELLPGQFYFAEPVDVKAKELNPIEKAFSSIKKYCNEFVESKKEWTEARVAVCWNERAKGAAYKDQSSFISVFRSLNIPVDTIFLKEKIDFTHINLLVVPYCYADSLTEYQLNRVTEFITNGGKLITDRRNKLSTKLGVVLLNSEIKVHALRDHLFPQEHIVWRNQELVYKIDLNPYDEVLCEDAATGCAMAFGREVGKGKFIYINTTFDAYSFLGYSSYPYLFDYIKSYLGLYPIIRNENLEVYFDPGFRQNTSIENLIRLWVKQGVRIVHVAGWHQYPKYTYDYGRLIKLAHANGIQVIAWIEPPQVSQKFWLENPKWREKNYKGQDVRASWRYPVALTDPACLKAATAEYMKLLKAFDWDGVNLGELYFESDGSFAKPEKYTPMHPSAITEFNALYGYNLNDIFNANSPYYCINNDKVRQQVINYRVNKVTQLHNELIKILTNYANTQIGFQVIVTNMDSYGSPELPELIGVNTAELINLQKKYDFLLQIEDPANRWSTDPLRYIEIGNMYAKLTGKPDKIMVDLNILSFRNQNEITPFPTLLQTGIESYHIVNASAIGAPRFTIYSEGTVNPQDMALFAYAGASMVKYKYTNNGYYINSPVSFVLRLPRGQKQILLNNQPIAGMRDNLFVIPAGENYINLHINKFPGFSTVAIQPQILSISGNLTHVNYQMRKIDFNYTSQGRCLVAFSHKPSSVVVDGYVYKTEVMRGNDCYTILLPNGNHKVTVITGNAFSYGISLTSLWSTNAIVIYGLLAVFMMVIMYLWLKILKRKYK